MKKIRISILTFGMALLAVACNNAQTQSEDASANPEINTGAMEQNHMEHNENMQNEDTKQMAMVSTNLSEETTKGLLSSYLTMKDALANDNANAAREEAQHMVDQLKGTTDELGRKILADAGHIGEENALDHKREHFVSLSNNMYILVKQVKTGQQLYWDHCPMAADGNGANWISSTKEIHNPYFGSEMPECGAMQEEI